MRKRIVIVIVVVIVVFGLGSAYFVVWPSHRPVVEPSPMESIVRIELPEPRYIGDV